MTSRSQCEGCEHLLTASKEGMTCRAYPDGVPMAVMFGEVLHNNVLKGQVSDFIYTGSEPMTVPIVDRTLEKEIEGV